MLFRRLTIVCLLLTLFGVSFAAIAANAERRNPFRTPCLYDQVVHCRVMSR